MTDDRLTRLQAMAQRFSANGSVDQITIRKINALALSSQLEEMSAEKTTTTATVLPPKEGVPA